MGPIRSWRRVRAPHGTVVASVGVVVASVALAIGPGARPAAAAVAPTASPAASPALAMDAPDPDIVLAGGTFYAFVTGTTWGNQIGIAKTTNADPAVGWTTLSGGAFGSSAFTVNPPASWEQSNTTTSPGVFEDNGTWIMFYDALQSSSGKYCISVAAASSVTGPYSDGSAGPLVCQTALGGSIDPQPFVNPTTGAAYLIWKSNDGSSGAASQVWSQPLGATGTTLSGSASAIFTVASATYPWETTTDDPSMVDAGGSYDLFFSGGNYQSDNYPTGYVVCSGPSGPCDQGEPTDPILSTNGGSGGGMVFTDGSGNWWLSYQTWASPACTNYGCGGSRQMFVTPLALPAAGPPQQNPGLPVQRIYGQDAIATTIAVSQSEFPAAGTARAVVLARSDFFSDALAGGPLAASLGGPMLITPGASISATLDPRVLAEIQRVLPAGGTVYVLGGDLALSATIDNQLGFVGYRVVREAGSDEYATAVDIAHALGDPATVFEATGLSFQDALSAVPAAIITGGAILLTNGSVQAPETAAYLAAHSGDTRYAIGGPLAAYGADPGATPVYGQDLFSTSAAVATTFFARAATFGSATGLNFPDALAGGPFIATGGRLGPMLLVQPSVPLPPSIDTYLLGDSQLTGGYLFGGPLAVGSDVQAAL